MKNKLIWLILAAGLVLALVACGNDANSSGTTEPTIPIPTYSVSAFKSDTDYPYPAIQNKLSWDAINKLPAKHEGMTIQEGRDMVVAFFNYAKTACWVPNTTISFVKNSKGSADIIEKGHIYGGLPYVGVGSGNIYRLMDYMDPNTGVVDLANAVNKDAPYDGWKTFGNQCSIGAYWGWGRVINSAKYTWTQACVAKNNFVMLGNLKVKDAKGNLIPIQNADRNWSSNTAQKPDNYGTDECIRDNKEQDLFEAYAKLLKGDGLVYYTTAGHVIMASSNATVVRKADNTIDGDKSYIFMTDQGQTWIEASNDLGDNFEYKGGVDTKMTFTALKKGNYIPFTFKEFTGEDPFDATVCKFSHTGEKITVAQLWESKVTANYGISDVYAVVYDSIGNEVYKHAVRAMQASVFELQVKEKVTKGDVPYVETWGKLYFDAGETYTVNIVVQLSTGERPTVYTGNLVNH